MKTKTITINVEKDVEEKFRKSAGVIYGKKERIFRQGFDRSNERMGKKWKQIM
jgi:hypothetical protein